MSARGVRRQVRAEWRKLRTVRGPWVALLLGLLAELVLRTVSAAIAPRGGSGSDVVFAARPSIAFLLVVALLPLLLASGEWRWRTVVPTFVVRPRRDEVLAAKAVVAVLTSTAVAGAATWVPLAVQLPVLADRDLPGIDPGVLLALALGPVAAGPFVGLVGLAVGTLVREQVAAVMTAAVLLFVAPLPLLLVGPEYYRWTPTAWVDALSAQRLVLPQLVPPTAAAVLLALTAVVALAVARSALLRRDVT